MGLAPLAALDDPDLEAHPLLAQLMRYAFEHFESIYGFKGLHWYKAKYHPHAWERRYLCFAGPRLKPRVGYAAIKVRSGDGVASFAAHQINRRLAKATRFVRETPVWKGAAATASAALSLL
jgi:phosphatidylglycerol lysyltransferase